MQSYLDEYCTHLKTKNFSPETLRVYSSIIEDFTKHCHTVAIPVEAAVKQTARDYIQILSVRKLNPISINNSLTALRLFFDYLLKRQVVGNNPFGTLPRHRKGRPLGSFVPVDEMRSLFKHIAETDCFSLRDIAMFEFFYATGLRTMELCNATMQDLSLSKEQIKVVQGKGRKDRIVPLTRQIVLILEMYLPMREIRFPTSDAIFPNTKGKRLKQGNVYKIIKSFLVLSSSKKKGAHTLRHSYATHLLAAGANIIDVQKLLGHRTPASTQVYDNNNHERLKKVFDKAHPKA